MEQVATHNFVSDPPAPAVDEDTQMAETTNFKAVKANGTSNIDVPMQEEDAEVKETASPIFASYDGANDGVAKKGKGRPPARAVVRPAKRPKTDVWSVENLLQKEKSKLLKVNLKSMLKDDEAWACLDAKTQNKIISMLPDARRAEIITTVNGKHQLNQQALMGNSSWNYFIGCVRDDISAGRNKPGWLQDANTAFMERQVGKYDTWKEKEYEEFWGTKQKLAANVIAGSSATLKWQDLIERGSFKPGDVFQYDRTVGGVKVKKDVEFMEIIGEGERGKTAIRCRFASGKRIIPKGDDEDIIRDDVFGPESLGRIAIEIHGEWNGSRLPNGNAWKVIRVIRKNQDLGTVWDVRQAVHFADAERGYEAPKKGRKASDADAYNGNGRATRTRRN